MIASVVPLHLAIIPDGNRRWAKEHGLPSLEGHRRGLKVAKEIALASFEHGVKYFTMYAFSTENWKRAQDEVGYLMDLFYGLIVHEFHELEKREVRFRFLGRREELPKKLLTAIDEAEAKTSHFTKGTLALCLNYSGQIELVDAFKQLVLEGVTPDALTPDLVTKYLYGPELPPVDLVIRTSGEQRISGFMLWRVAYAEFYFVQKHWPEFTTTDLESALDDFANRQRRYGK